MIFVYLIFVDWHWSHFLVSVHDVWNLRPCWPEIHLFLDMINDSSWSEPFIGKLNYPPPMPSTCLHVVFGLLHSRTILLCPNHPGPGIRQLREILIPWSPLKLLELANSKPAGSAEVPPATSAFDLLSVLLCGPVCHGVPLSSWELLVISFFNGNLLDPLTSSYLREIKSTL